MGSKDVSIITLIDTMFHQAIDARASDIHIEPTKDTIRVRFRIDGCLVDKDSLPIEFSPQIIARCKVLAQMNSTQKRMPQDGKFCLSHATGPIDLRISTFPSVFGEKVVIRILDSSVHTMHLENLGMSQTLLDQFRNIISKPQGFFLVTGPTGSGKTTTLYAALHFLHSPEKNIVTLEDPVEYSLQGITQAQINSDAGFTFDHGIRSVLRQDPDIIMIGEIRDKITARAAVEAAMTGHMVLSTLHTNDAPSSIIRLMDMGIEPYLINTTLTGVLAQRLVRVLCSHCKKSHTPTDEEQKIVDRLGIFLSHLFSAQGCELCDYLGYKGRMGIFELLPLSDAIRSCIIQNPNIDNLYEKMHENNIVTLKNDAIEKCKQGYISLAQLLHFLW